MRHLRLFTIFLLSFATTLALTVKNLDLKPSSKVPALLTAYVATPHIFASLPQENPQVLGVISTQDARPLILRNYLGFYSSPLEPLSDYVVQISDKYGLDFRLLPAIAMQESNLCKYIPPDSYNCWGYGIYGDQVIRFNSYEEGLERVAKTLRDDYLGIGLNTPEKIMRKYTPPSDGSWANGVNLFLDIMEKGGIPKP